MQYIKEHKCQYQNCDNHIVHTLYQYCSSHMYNQKPLKIMEIPENCPICYEDEQHDNGFYITLTCGHQLHKECMIKCGRPICPICKQFVYMTPDVFLRLRINNLRWKLDHLKTNIQNDVIITFKKLFNDFETILITDANDTTLKFMDNILSKFNTLVLNWYYN